MNCYMTVISHNTKTEFNESDIKNIVVLIISMTDHGNSTLMSFSAFGYSTAGVLQDLAKGHGHMTSSFMDCLFIKYQN